MSDMYDLLSPDESKDYIRVKQATKQGYILCENSGRPILSKLKATPWQSSEGGANLSHSHSR